MSKSKAKQRQRKREWVSTRARAAAVEAARRKKMRRRVATACAAGVLVLALVGAAAFTGGGESKTTTTSTPFTPTTLASAAGKPCVGLTDPLPTGAPSFTIPTGAPPTELQKIDLKVGEGPEVTAGQNVTVNYVGVLCSTGKIFDASYQRQQPVSRGLANFIPGWQQGIPGMRIGGQRLLGIPPALAYGSEGGGDDIAPDETLWFLIDMLSAK